MPKVTLPEGCYGLDGFSDGSRVDGKSGCSVEVTDSQAREIDGSWTSRTGVVSGSQQLSFGTISGKRCVPCRRLWNSWTDVCHKCGCSTTPER